MKDPNTIHAATRYVVSWHFWSAAYAVQQFNSAHADIRSTVSVVIRSGLCQVNEDPKWLIPQLISIQKWWMFPSDMCVGPICLFTSRFDVLIRRDISDVLEPVVLPSSVSCYMLKLCKRTCWYTVPNYTCLVFRWSTESTVSDSISKLQSQFDRASNKKILLSRHASAITRTRWSFGTWVNCPARCSCHFNLMWVIWILWISSMSFRLVS